MCHRQLVSSPAFVKKVQKFRPRDGHRFSRDALELRMQRSLPDPARPAKCLVRESARHDRGKNPRLLWGKGVLRTELRNFFIKRTHHQYHPYPAGSLTGQPAGVNRKNPRRSEASCAMKPPESCLARSRDCGYSEEITYLAFAASADILFCRYKERRLQQP